MSAGLYQHLMREHEAVQAFIEVLDQEAEAMRTGAFGALPALAQRKAELVEQIAQLDAEREQAQARLGYPADRPGADALAAAAGAAAQEAWEQLCELALQAHERNHRNGVMVHTNLDFTRQAIGFLKAGAKPLYGPDGTHRTGRGAGKHLAAG